MGNINLINKVFKRYKIDNVNKEITDAKILLLLSVIQEYSNRIGLREIVLSSRMKFSNQVLKFLTTVEDFNLKEVTKVKNILEEQ